MIRENQESVADAARRLYDEKLRETLEQEHRDESVAIEPISGEYFLAKTLSEAKGTLVYYPTGLEMVKASGPTKLTEAGEALTFTLPLHHQEAYPNLAKASVKVKAEVEGAANVELEVAADFSKVDDKRKVKGTLKLRDATSAEAWSKLKEGAKKIKLTFKGADLPGIVDLSITK